MMRLNFMRKSNRTVCVIMSYIVFIDNCLCFFDLTSYFRVTQIHSDLSRIY